ncbi:hypothetical protein CSA56_14435 [candidate division KSB3 bacterium]|uniref:Uncharacterized protein n=1 Tax=candidate division KSB3 bacterium TaxID=2044937 RepID=A0A2G6KCJ6_9BACT|nr:MAG: hypothetical protein CSA56_14435 [candidate division KSB3 bacterium]
MTDLDYNFGPRQDSSHSFLTSRTEQETLAQLVRKYHFLRARCETLTQENRLLRDDVENFNRKLLECEGELERYQQQDADMVALLRQMHAEEVRLPLRQARPFFRELRAQECEVLADEQECELARGVLCQELLPLNIWLATTNRFVGKVVGHYIRRQDRVLVIRDYRIVKKCLSIGILPDMIVTGTYDFGLDDPGHTNFLAFLDRTFADFQEHGSHHELYIITLSSNIEEQTNFITRHARYNVRHEFISKFQGLKTTLSEMRFFLEMRRCQADIMQAERSTVLDSFDDAAQMVFDIQQYQKTGIMTILSDELPLKTRWVLLMFFLKGKMVKTEHTLETPMIFPPGVDGDPVEKVAALFSSEAEHERNVPKSLHFFPLYQRALLHEFRKQPSA